jgi:hypothetical protein
MIPATLAACLIVVLPSHAGPTGSTAAGPAAAAPATQQMDSLVAAAQRAAQAWRRHDFEALVEGAGVVRLQLPGAEPTGWLREAQAAALLRAFVAGADEREAEVVVVRRVDEERAYVEVRREFMVEGTAARRSETLYLGMRRRGAGFRLADVRIVR